MDANLENYDLAGNHASIKAPVTKSGKAHKSKKCNQCDFASSRADVLRRHFKIHSGEKSNKCNQCVFASADAGNLRTHLKNTVEKNQTNATNATMYPFCQAI